jgi:hypothetical protein
VKPAQRLQAVADLAWAGRHEEAIAAATAALRLKMLDADDAMTLLDLRSESATHEREVEGSVRYLDHDRIEIIHHGRQRTIPAGAWEAVDDHCTWDLATRTSSCRIRAGARTPGSE